MKILKFNEHNSQESLYKEIGLIEYEDMLVGKKSDKISQNEYESIVEYLFNISHQSHLKFYNKEEDDSHNLKFFKGMFFYSGNILRSNYGTLVINKIEDEYFLVMMDTKVGFRGFEDKPYLCDTIDGVFELIDDVYIDGENSKKWKD